MIAFPKRRTHAAAAAAVIFLVSGILPVRQLPSAINWNVLLMISGTMVMVSYFVSSKMPNRIARSLTKRCPNVLWLTICMSVFSGVISAFIDNVATVLVVAPIAITICRELKINPIPMVLSVAVSAAMIALSPAASPPDQ